MRANKSRRTWIVVMRINITARLLMLFCLFSYATAYAADNPLLGTWRLKSFVREVAGTSHRLPSGPLHDAAEVARAGIPTVMLFVQSLRGLSHTKLEDTKEEHLELAVRAFDGLTTKALEAFA